jgi:hypothetical protein
MLAITRHLRAQTKTHSQTKVFHSEELSLRIAGGGYCPSFFEFGSKEILATIIDSICTRPEMKAIKGYIHSKNSLGYYLGGGQESCPTLFGGAVELLMVMKSYEVALKTRYKWESFKCSLRLAAPSATKLHKLTEALPHLKAHPYTLGVDIGSNSYFCIKGWEDMKLLLGLIANSNKEEIAMTAPDLKHIELHELTYPKGVF